MTTVLTNRSVALSPKMREEQRAEREQYILDTKIENVLTELGGYGVHQFLVTVAAAFCDISV